jgi:hypothetical protein
MCTTNFGFLGWGHAVSLCGQTLTNISVTIRPLSDPSIRLGYSERWLFIGGTNEMRMPGQVFPEFDGFLPAHPEYYENMVWTVVARDNLGHVATRQAVYHYDFTPPVLNCSNLTATSANGVDAVVDYTFGSPNIWQLLCTPPSGTTFPVGVTPVTCRAVDLCRNTNTCSFNVTVRDPNEDCVLRIALTQAEPPVITLTWDCPGILESAPDVDGPWSDLPGAVSPHPLAATPERKFFRVRQTGP